MNLKTGFSHLDMEPLPLKTKGNPCRPKGFIPDLIKVPRLTSENDPRSGATGSEHLAPLARCKSWPALEAGCGKQVVTVEGDTQHNIG